MISSVRTWTCSSCGAAVDAPDQEWRKPCEKCGSSARTAHVSVADTLQVAAYLKTKARHRDGGSKFVREVTQGDDLHFKTGKWNLMRRVIDRANNWYEETFRDRETGEVIHHTAEPLTDHKKSPGEK